ncbi:MAG: exodeoxyribonuclease III [Bdellovibrionaceae bacterium]|nr:exodeoxyribonuclease III [Pseudobdellovibrionaceae bacterium]
MGLKCMVVTMKIVSWNVNGIRACAKKGLEEFIAQEKPDIFCVQETKAHLEQVDDRIKNLGYKRALWSSAIRKGYSGVATFSNQDWVTETTHFEIKKYEDEGRTVITDFGPFVLYNIYFPNGGSGDVRHQFKQEFLKELNKHLAKTYEAGKQIVVVGDYNVAHREADVYDPVRLSKESGFLPEERQWFEEFLKIGFVDTFRLIHPDVKDKYTWWNYRELARISNRGWRIDYICVSRLLAPLVRDAKIHDEIEGSDHCPVSIILDIN